MKSTIRWVHASYVLILIVGFIGVARPEAITLAFMGYFAFITIAAVAAFNGMGRMMRTA
jgi:hypothetical protein